MSKRLEKFRQILKEREIPAAIVTDELNIGYLCGFRYSDGYLLVDESRAYLVTDFRYYEEAKARREKVFEVVMPEDRNAFNEDFLKSGRHTSLGFEGESMTYSAYERYRDFLSVPLVPLGDVFPFMRAEKSAEEIALIKKAQGITDAAYTHILNVITPEITEREIALELSYFMQKNGAEETSFDIIAVSGEASALPHGKCRNQKISKGFLTMDFGCIYEGYCSDMTRTVCIGRADEEMRRLYDTVLNAQKEALSVIRAGETCGFVDGVARSYIEKAGYAEAFGHGLGHGVGLYIHERPSLSPRATATPLRVGNVITVEPGIYLMGKYGCRIEDMGVVTADGFDNFTKSPKELIELFA